MQSSYPQLENVVKYLSVAASVGFLIVYIWATERSQRHPDRPAWPLIAWLVAALVMFHLLLDLFYWRRLSVWTVHFAIRCAALVGILVLAIRERKREAEEIISSHR